MRCSDNVIRLAACSAAGILGTTTAGKLGLFVVIDLVRVGADIVDWDGEGSCLN